MFYVCSVLVSVFSSLLMFLVVWCCVRFLFMVVLVCVEMNYGGLGRMVRCFLLLMSGSDCGKGWNGLCSIDFLIWFSSRVLCIMLRLLFMFWIVLLGNVF